MSKDKLLKDTQVALKIWDRALSLAIMELEMTHCIDTVQAVKEQFIEMAIEDERMDIKY